MEVSSIITWVVIIGAAVWAIAIYNQLVQLKNRFQNGFAQIEVQLKRRYDLIPNLVESAKAYLSHERETLEAVIEARNMAAAGLSKAAREPGQASAASELVSGEKALGGALARFNVAVEAYPELKADANMRQLNEELTSTENKVAFARQAFNDQVMSFNIYRQSFPQKIVAGWFGHPKDASLLEFADSAEIMTAPKVAF
ncbi:MAG: LemA protein [Candidatus Azotimanducaceae bacterium]|jgi:LemA protein